MIDELVEVVEGVIWWKFRSIPADHREVCTGSETNDRDGRLAQHIPVEPSIAESGRTAGNETAE